MSFQGRPHVLTGLAERDLDFAFTDMMNAYGTFKAASANKALKVIIEF